MRVPQPLKEAEDSGIVVDTTADGSAIVVDLGARATEAAVDVIDGTAIVVYDDEQVEFELPPEAGDVTTNNGVLTIKE